MYTKNKMPATGFPELVFSAIQRLSRSISVLWNNARISHYLICMRIQIKRLNFRHAGKRVDEITINTKKYQWIRTDSNR